MAYDFSSLIPSASPFASAGLDPQEALASDDPYGRLSAAQAGVPYLAKPGQKSVTLASTPQGSSSSPIGAVQRTGVSNPPDGGAVRTTDSPSSYALPRPQDSHPIQPANNAPNPDSETPSGPQAVPSSVQPSGAQSKFSDITRQMLGMKQQALNQAQAVPNAPDVGGLEQQRTAATAAAPNPNDQQYKPTFKSRFLRGLEGVGLGLAEGGLRGAIAGGIAPQTTGLAGYRDPNSAFNRDKTASDKTVGSLDQQLNAAQAQQKIANEQKTAETGVANSAGTGAEQATQAGNAEKPTGKAQIITAGDGSLFSVDPDDPTHPSPITGPDGKPIMGKGDGKYVQLEIGGQPHTVEVDDKGNTIKDLGATGEKPTNIHVGEQGTWSLQEDKDGNPVLFNSKTAETKDATGMQKSGTAAKAKAAQDKISEPVDAAMSYAEDYAKRPPTGSGDEALMEKYFELAKPSTGFRMTQPQIDMLNHAQSLMTGLEAKARHFTTGTYYTDKQRKEIIDTMRSLGAAKKAAISKAGGGAAPAAAAPAASKGGFNWEDHPKVNP